MSAVAEGTDQLDMEDGGRDAKTSPRDGRLRDDAQLGARGGRETGIGGGGDGTGRRSFGLQLFRSPLVWLGVLVVLGHILYLTGIFDPNPMLIHSNMSKDLRFAHGVSGANSLDPNEAFTSQALAHRAMLDWIHGQVPWWNPYEGVGTALAGEMQSAAFFPFAILTLMSNGQMWMYLVLGLIAAYSTYFLIRRLGFSPWIAFVAGVCFGLNGTFAWFRFAPANPVAFLPLMLLGVEIARERVQEGRRSHWWIIAVGLSLSLVAGFPETTYVDGLLVTLWAAVRCFGLSLANLKRFLTVTVGGAITGLLLSAPFLVGVIGFLPYASLGPNTDTGLQTLPPRAISMLFFPYGYGGLWSHEGGKWGHLAGNAWGLLGGYTTVALLLLAAFGLMHRELRALKVALAGWCLVVVAAGYGLPVFESATRLIPGIKHVVLARYMNPSLTMALVVLAAFGLRDIIKGRLRWWQIAVPVIGVTVAAAAVAYEAHSLSRKIEESHALFAVAIGWGFVTIAVIAVAAVLLKWRASGPGERQRPKRGIRRLATFALIAVLPFEAVGMFVVPETSAPRSGQVDMPLVHFLQHHMGYGRYMSLGPILPNYGSYFSIASLTENDLPLPQRFSNLILGGLDPNTDPVTFTGTVQSVFPGLTPVGAFRRYIRNYEALGSRYLLVAAAQPAATRSHHRHGAAAGGRRDRRLDRHARNHRRTLRDHHRAARGHRHAHSSRSGQPVTDFRTHPGYLGHCTYRHRCRHRHVNSPRVYGSRIPRSLRGLGLREVYGDSVAVVYALPHYNRLFRSVNGDCRIAITGWYAARSDCRRADAVVYAQVYMPGWKATVNGRGVKIAATGYSQQRIAVPAGQSTIRFSYAPKYATVGWIAAIVGLIACLFSMGLFSRPLAALRGRRGPGGRRPAEVTP